MTNNEFTSARGGFKNKIKIFWAHAVAYLNPTHDLESQADIEASIRSGVSFKGSQLLILIFAIFIASLGLNTNSIPVIIGAMLISPLMGPIIGMGLGIGIHDFSLLKKGLKNISAAIIGSLLTSALYFLISPQYEGSSQLLARTSPSIYDVFVALFGGAAGILSIAAKNKGQVLPGVAIATSLMPPLCTAGYGLATWQMNFFLGAFYLFFTNFIFIFVASWAGVKLMGFKPVSFQTQGRAQKVKIIAYSLVGVVIGVSVYLTVVMISKNVFLDKASAFVENEMVFPNTQVLSHKEYIEGNTRHIDVTLIGEALPKDSLQLAMVNKLDSVGLGGTVLNIKQGFAINDLNDNMSEDRFYKIMQTELADQQAKIDSLNTVIKQRDLFNSASRDIAPEVQVVFPNISDIALAQMVATSVADDQADTVNMIFVNAPQGLTLQDRQRLRRYVGVRLGMPNLDVTLNPKGFPWPKPNPKREPAKTN